jgi:HPt (histidine-containing phosphotransfer) domain-containing protein
MAEGQSVDQAALDKLQKLGGDRFVQQMITLFVDFGGQKVKEARTALEVRDIQRVEKCVHAIKSSAMNLGANQVWEVASAMEELTKEGSQDSLPRLQTQLEREFERAKGSLEKKARELAD